MIRCLVGEGVDTSTAVGLPPTVSLFTYHNGRGWACTSDASVGKNGVCVCVMVQKLEPLGGLVARDGLETASVSVLAIRCMHGEGEGQH